MWSRRYVENTTTKAEHKNEILKDLIFLRINNFIKHELIVTIRKILALIAIYDGILYSANDKNQLNLNPENHTRSSYGYPLFSQKYFISWEYRKFGRIMGES